MEILGNPSWRWGLTLIVLTITFHAAGVLIMAFVGTRIRFNWKREASISGA